MEVIQSNLKYKELVPLNLSKVLFIIIHHIDAVTATPEDIHQWHLQNGWSGAGYNEYIRKDGTVYIMRGDNIGAHCANVNSKSYGIALEGNYDNETILPLKQFSSLVERLKYHRSRLPNLVEIAGHNKFSSTTCPGKYLDINTIISCVDNIPSQLEQDIAILKRNAIISSPQYWLDNAILDKTCRGEFVATLIHNVATRLKG